MKILGEHYKKFVSASMVNYKKAGDDEIPHDGDVPSPEEFLIYLSACVEKGKN